MYLFRYMSFLISCLLCFASVAVAEHSPKPSYPINDAPQVLILHSYHPGMASTDRLMAGLQEALLETALPPNFHVEYMDTKRHPDSEYFNHVLDAILHYKLQGHRFDLLIVSGNEALNFGLEHREDLFRETPIVFTAIEAFPPEQIANQTQITGVYQRPDYQDLFKVARQLHPNASRAIVVGRTSGYSDQLITEKLKRITAENNDFNYEFWNDYNHQDLLEKLKLLGQNDLIFINGLYTDENGNLPCILKSAELSSPVYSPLELYFGKGTIGGPLTDDREQGRLAGEIALKILSGDDPDKIPALTPKQQPARFDRLMLEKFDIPAALLPSDATLINQPEQNTYPLSRKLLYGIIVSLIVAVALIFFLSTNYLKRTKAERLYRQLAQQLEVILNGIPDKLTLISPDMKVIWSNKNASNLLASQLGQEQGEFCCKLLYNNATLCENCPAIDALTSGNSEEAVITTPAGQILEVKAFPLKDQSGRITSAILLASDITEKNHLRDEAIRSSRLASLGELAAGVAHEINNPNALIKLNIELLQKVFNGAMPILQQHFNQHGDFALGGGLSYTELNEELPYLFSELLEGTERIKHIVNDLKDFSRNDTPDHSDKIDLNELLQTAVRLLNNTIKKSTDHFSTDYAPQLPTFDGSFQRIEQVVVNLLANACQSLSGKDRAIWAKTKYDSQSQQIILQITDEGTGIAEEHLEHITEPFFTTKRKEGGTGLGLSVASRIIQDHSGELKFRSKLGEGTTVTLSFPVKRSGA